MIRDKYWDYQKLDWKWQRWQNIVVHELAHDYDLESISLGKGEERHVCVCSRPPTHIEMAELRGEPLKTEEKAEKDSHTKKQHRTGKDYSYCPYILVCDKDLNTRSTW